MNYNQSIDRIKDMIKRDKEELNPELINLMKSDIFSVLSSYVILSLSSMDLKYSVEEDNLYHFSLNFTAKNIKHITYMS